MGQVFTIPPLSSVRKPKRNVVSMTLNQGAWNLDNGTRYASLSSKYRFHTIYSLPKSHVSRHPPRAPQLARIARAANRLPTKWVSKFAPKPTIDGPQNPSFASRVLTSPMGNSIGLDAKGCWHDLVSILQLFFESTLKLMGFFGMQEPRRRKNEMLVECGGMENHGATCAAPIRPCVSLEAPTCSWSSP